MKLVIIIIILFSLVLLIPNHAEASYESSCKLIAKTVLSGGGYGFDQKRYDSCINNFEKQDMWRSIKQWGIGLVLLVVFGVVGIVAFKSFLKPKTTHVDVDYTYTSPIIRKGWTVEEKEQVRIRQDGKCAHCGKPPPRWEYHHANGDRGNNSLENCEGLCPNCHSVQTHEG